ncbi:competence type IV pilus minor pilin ComGD [Radiobacillus deserti]|uniref:competence type IV pilus minor pilin ComGD n=1 Tax=Radiobacillus deserti TaxID=2594883 RepID=UPI0013154D3D|nr:competence type IV pilus minor pilin ComGD [Radiobacillus deserti]
MSLLSKNDESGFTLLETLIVLGITSSLIVISSASLLHWKQSYEANQFFDVFKSDILFLQQIAMDSGDYYYLFIQPDENAYEIRKGGYGKVIRRRLFPKSWSVQLLTLSMPLSFTPHGQIRNPGSFLILTKEKTYKIVFPFGKGRGYVVTQS